MYVSLVCKGVLMVDSSTNEYCFDVSGDGAQRLDRFLSVQMQGEIVSREKIKKTIKNAGCTVNGKPCCEVAHRLFPGDRVCMVLDAPSSHIIPESGILSILYEDEHLVVLNKEAGLTVHPAPSCSESTLVHRLLARFPQLQEQSGARPGIVHRLDKDTSGLICIALSEEARLRLSEAFAAREVRKEYLALALGVPQPAEVNEDSLKTRKTRKTVAKKPGTAVALSCLTAVRIYDRVEPPLAGSIALPIGRHPLVKTKMAVVPGGKPAASDWKVLLTGRGGGYSLLAVRIHTGRTHQIRVHLSHIGHPLLGDSLYGNNESGASSAKRQMLHAWKLSLAHPVTGQHLHFVCPPPEDFLETALCMEQAMQRIVVTSVAGCGKSAFLHCLRKKNIPVWSADEAVIRLYEPAQAGWQVILHHFGQRFIASPSSPVDRKALAAALLPPSLVGGRPHESTIPSSDVPQERPVSARDLEEMIHPLVKDDLNVFWDTCAQNKQELAVAEIPLWFESASLFSQSRQDGDTTVVGISCSENERRRRLLEVRGWTEDLLAYMDSLQWSQKRKMAACDIVIPNDGSLEELEKECETLLATLADRRAAADEVFKGRWEHLVDPQAE